MSVAFLESGAEMLTSGTEPGADGVPGDAQDRGALVDGVARLDREHHHRPVRRAQAGERAPDVRALRESGWRSCPRDPAPVRRAP